MTELRPTASDIHIGGGNVSVSMLGTWWRCPRLWFWQYLYPWPSGERGVEPKYTASPLMVGSGVHVGLAAWYMSGWQDGNYALDPALDAARNVFKSRRAEFESEERYASDLAEVERLLRAYDGEYGPNAHIPEFPTFRAATQPANTTKPYIESTFNLTLKTGHILTVRPDMIGVNHGMLVAVEHKTPGASRVSATIGEATLGGQGLAQAAVLRKFDAPTSGQLLNLVVKGPVRNTKPFQRHVIGFDPHIIDHFLHMVEQTIGDIERTVARWYTLLDDGMAAIEAARVMFPMAGILNGNCHRFNRPCPMFGLDTAPGREAATLANYRVRTYKSDKPTEEET